MLADWMRQTFVVIGLLYVLLHQDWKLALVSLVVLPTAVVPTVRLGRRIRRTTRSAQDNAAELNEILQETISGQQVVVDTYVAEMMPGKSRGRYVAINQTVGFTAVPVVAYLSALLVPTHWLLDGWRWVMLIGGSGAVFAWETLFASRTTR